MAENTIFDSDVAQSVGFIPQDNTLQGGVAESSALPTIEDLFGGTTDEAVEALANEFDVDDVDGLISALESGGKIMGGQQPQPSQAPSVQAGNVKQGVPLNGAPATIGQAVQAGPRGIGQAAGQFKNTVNPVKLPQLNIGFGG